MNFDINLADTLSVCEWWLNWCKLKSFPIWTAAVTQTAYENPCFFYSIPNFFRSKSNSYRYAWPSTYTQIQDLFIVYIKDIKPLHSVNSPFRLFLLSQIVYPSGVQTTATYLSKWRRHNEEGEEKNVCSIQYWIAFILRKQHINDDIELIIIREMCHMDNITPAHDYSVNDIRKKNVARHQ